MPFRTSPPSTRVALVAVFLALAATPAAAAGLGAEQAPVVLGQPLDFVVPLRLEPGELLEPGCVFAEVMLGDRRLASSALRTTLEDNGAGSLRVRVGSTLVVDEPVVTVTVTAGCGSSVSRRYVLLVDLPIGGAPLAVVAPPAAPATAVVQAPAFAAHPTPIGSDAGALAPASAVAVQASYPVPAAAGGGDTARGGVEAPARSGRASARAAAAAPNPRPTASTSTPSRRARAAAAAGAPDRGRPAAARSAARAPAPRLRLEATEPVKSAEAAAVEEAIAAVAEAASAVRAAASAASAASARVATLEGQVEQLNAQARAQREASEQLRERLADADTATRWVLPLLGLVLLLAGLALWLAWRLTSLQRRREQDWRSVVAPPAPPPPDTTAGKLPTAPIPFVVSELANAAPPKSRIAPAWPPPSQGVVDSVPADAPPPPAPSTAGVPSDGADTDTAMQMTQPFTLPVTRDGARDVSIEELIDLEQQAEFFVVLGQDDAAIDLLVEHLRNTGGSSPLPYLKLLEIYGRRGDHEAYERMRSRFNRRFNAYAPEWGMDLSAGRSLEDYGGVVPRLQAVWQRPMEAMAELEALLFRRSRGELFDLPAYREVLFLYSLARDLLDREALASGNIDLLIPMAEGAEFGPTTPHPYLGLESDAMPLGPREERNTVPVDLDLTRPDPPSSIFDLPEDGTARNR